MSNRFRFTPAAYQKIVWCLRKTSNEVGLFGISSANDICLIEDVVFVPQISRPATIEMEDLNQYVEKMSLQGIPPGRCFRVWIHTHPGDSTTPSMTDEQTFTELLADHPWFVMMIFGRNLSASCAVGIKSPRMRVSCAVEVDWSIPCTAVDFEQLDAEFTENVVEGKYTYNDNPYNAPSGTLFPIPERYKPKKNQYFNNYDHIEWKPSQKKSVAAEDVKKIGFSGGVSLSEMDMLRDSERSEEERLEKLIKNTGIRLSEVVDYIDKNNLTISDLERWWDDVRKDLQNDYTF